GEHRGIELRTLVGDLLGGRRTHLVGVGPGELGGRRLVGLGERPLLCPRVALAPARGGFARRSFASLLCRRVALAPARGGFARRSFASLLVGLLEVTQRRSAPRASGPR